MMILDIRIINPPNWLQLIPSDWDLYPEHYILIFLRQNQLDQVALRRIPLISSNSV